MRKSEAVGSWRYWGNQIYTTLGRKNRKAKMLRAAYAHAISSGCYKKLPSNALEADSLFCKGTCPICGIQYYRSNSTRERRAQ
jgi:hypothetical protein